MSAAAEVATDVVETVADAAEETIQALDMVNNLNGTTRKQQVIVLVAAVAVGAAVGAGVSWVIANRKLSLKYETLMEEELEKTREFFANRREITIDKTAEIPDPEEVLAMEQRADEAEAPKPKTDYAAISRKNEFLDGIAPNGVAAQSGDVDEVSAMERSVFEEDVEQEWLLINSQNEAQKKPHVISKDDFFEAENDYSQFTFTYFAGDDVLADEKEDLVPDYDKVVGSWNLERFGWLSEDANTVFLRVPEHEMELEIIKSDGTFAQEVHGFTHSDDDFERIRKGGRVRFGED